MCHSSNPCHFAALSLTRVAFRNASEIGTSRIAYSGIQRDTASRMGHLISDGRYYYLCYQWIVGPQADWDQHCQHHLETMTSLKCGRLTYCNTPIRPGYCPFCLGDDSLPPSTRCQSRTRENKLTAHILDKPLEEL